MHPILQSGSSLKLTEKKQKFFGADLIENKGNIVIPVASGVFSKVTEMRETKESGS